MLWFCSSMSKKVVTFYLKVARVGLGCSSATAPHRLAGGMGSRRAYIMPNAQADGMGEAAGRMSSGGISGGMPMSVGGRVSIAGPPQG